jgi:hypothetical protein
MVAIARECDIRSARPGIIRFYAKVSSPLGGDVAYIFRSQVHVNSPEDEEGS